MASHGDKGTSQATALRSWLEEEQFLEYYPVMMDLGFDNLNDIRVMSDQELKFMFGAVNMKPGHIMRFRRAIQTKGTKDPQRGNEAFGSAADVEEYFRAQDMEAALQWQAVTSAKFVIGQPVEAWWDDAWYAAEIASVDKDGTYTVLFPEDRTVGSGVAEGNIRLVASAASGQDTTQITSGVEQGKQTKKKKKNKPAAKPGSQQEKHTEEEDEPWQTVQMAGYPGQSSPQTGARYFGCAPPQRAPNVGMPAASLSKPQKGGAKAVARSSSSSRLSAPAAPSTPLAFQDDMPVPSKMVDVLRLLPDGRLGSTKLPESCLKVKGTFSIPECAESLAGMLCFGHFSGQQSERQRLSDKGSGVMILQMRSSPNTYLLSVKPCEGMGSLPFNEIATSLIKNKDMRCYGPALVLSYTFSWLGQDVMQHQYSPVAHGQFVSIHGVKTALQKAEEHRALEDKYKAQPMASTAAKGAMGAQARWTFSSFGSHNQGEARDPLHQLISKSAHDMVKQKEAEVEKARKAEADHKHVADQAQKEKEETLRRKEAEVAQAKRHADQAQKEKEETLKRKEAEVAKAKQEELKHKEAAERMRKAKEAAEREAAATKRNAVPEAQIPSYWSMERSGRHVTKFMKPIVQTVLLTSSVHHACYATCRALQQAVVAKVERIENTLLWTRYQQAKHCIALKYHSRTLAQLNPPVPDLLDDLDRSRALDSGVNEVYLFHGTTEDNAKIIAAQGFDSRLAADGLYGKGTYFAHEACKALQYSRGAAVIVSRVVLGDPYYAPRADTSMRRPPAKSSITHELYDSVVANPGTDKGSGSQVHREYIIFEGAQAYPEFIATFV
eukprot:TRINITY_DN19321_c0_g1_i1.p1 TRINITY_DN19321_c0_g1~~TRINITY_DN19321_c0_g1_i1.p1  ORF type:complete len:836 (-),score=127.93 TRINITY_DN19321_c0_g1_i1:180-2687(-)